MIQCSFVTIVEWCDDKRFFFTLQTGKKLSPIYLELDPQLLQIEWKKIHANKVTQCDSRAKQLNNWLVKSKPKLSCIDCLARLKPYINWIITLDWLRLRFDEFSIFVQSKFAVHLFGLCVCVSRLPFTFCILPFAVKMRVSRLTWCLHNKLYFAKWILGNAIINYRYLF